MTRSNSEETVAQPRPWRKTRVAVLALGAFATLLAIAYTVESWRGRRAWERCKRELAAKGEVIDWQAYIPPPVPDDQNVFKAPHIAEWFVRKWNNGHNTNQTNPFGGSEKSAPLEAVAGISAVVPVADITVTAASNSTAAGRGGPVLRLDDPRMGNQLREILLKALGHTAPGFRGSTLVRQSSDDIKPAELTIETATAPRANQISDLIELAGVDGLFVRAAGSNKFGVELKFPAYAAADYLAWSEQFNPVFDALRRALERPLARMEGGYEVPMDQPIVNFVTLRSCAQILGERAQCHLLLGQPEGTLEDLSLIHDTCRLLDPRPVTLVAAMIKTAIIGLYVEVIHEGLLQNTWREPQLVALQDQLRQLNLISTYCDSIRAERAASCETLGTTSPSRLASILASGRSNTGFWESIRHPEFWLLSLAPRGWIYQNEVSGTALQDVIFENVDPTNQMVRPEIINQWLARMSSAGFSPYTALAMRFIPNLSKASSTVARNQTLVNEALVACALERYRLVHHEYPETLAALVPAFLEAVPHDVIGGLPLHYRRTTDGRYSLYSVGWDGKDDGGVPGKIRGEGDWVWQPPLG